MISLTIALTRAELLTDNDRMHRMVRARRVKALRTKAHWAALADRLSFPTIESWPVTVKITYSFPTRRRPTDANNLAATTKALVDGLVDSQILFPDDDIAHVEGQDSRINPEPTRDERGLIRALIEIIPA